MDRNQENRNNNNNNNNNRNDHVWDWVGAAVGTLAGVATLGGFIYAATQYSKRQEEQEVTSQQKSRQEARERDRERERRRQICENIDQNNSTVGSYLSELINRVGNTSISANTREPSPNPLINNLNSLIEDITVRYILIKDRDFELYYGVFYDVFSNLHEKMKEVDLYYGRYSSNVKFAGSHYDRLRIGMPSEFDMDVVLRLPLNMYAAANPRDSDISIEATSPGFVQLKMGVQYQRLPFGGGPDWDVNKAAYDWKDEKNFLLRTKFLNWFKGVVVQALNKFQLGFLGRRLHYVKGVPYIIRLSESGPAVTLIIENHQTGFRCDVDLVPALRFPESRWPVSKAYRDIPDRCKRDYWMVVPKATKAAASKQELDRSWRIALHEQERELMYDSYNLRNAIRLVKQLRNTQKMNAIASYYIKSLFYQEIVERNDPSFWSRNNPATLFKLMLEKLLVALVTGSLPFFWNKDNNLFGQIPRTTLNEYARKVQKVLELLNDTSNYKRVAEYLLSPSEFQDYNRRFLHI